MKKVIFIGGTAYSGSTMLDMMIGNSPTTFSAGEVRGVFEPRRLQHIYPTCGCGDSQCTIWNEIRKSKVPQLYQELFKNFPAMQTIVDSSKEPLWILQQLKNLQSRGISTYVILIWKSPAEFALSRLKRNSLKSWKRAWINYHRLFFTLIKDWRSVRYRDIVQDPDRKLREICDYTGLPFRKGMKNYWEKKHHTVFGNTSAKFHTYEANSKEFDKSVDSLTSLADGTDNQDTAVKVRHRSIYKYDNIESLLPESIFKDANSESFDKFIDIINLYDVGKKSFPDSQNDSPFGNLLLPMPYVELFRTKKALELKWFFIRHLNRIKAVS